MKAARIAIVGNLVGVANEILIALRDQKFLADLYVEEQDVAVTLENPEIDRGWVTKLSPSQPVNTYRAKLLRALRQLSILLRLSRSDEVHCYTGTLINHRLLFLYFVRLKRRPYLAFATGSDLREVAAHEQGARGDRMREFFSKASRVLLLNVDMPEVAQRLNLAQAEFFPFMINEKRYSPRSSSTRSGKLQIFMMSRLDFGLQETDPGKSSMKKNHLFFEALAEYVKSDRQVQSVVLDRGVDRELAKQMVRELGLTEFVVFHPPLTQQERIEQMAEADVIVDQFHPGAMGLGSLEALAMGKPLITYVNQAYLAQSYGEHNLPPILNARTAKDILSRLHETRSPEVRKVIGGQAREWLVRNHSRDVVLKKLFALSSAR